jgi:3D (Asp-Asp-Asp) domain-containing protein
MVAGLAVTSGAARLTSASSETEPEVAIAPKVSVTPATAAVAAVVESAVQSSPDETTAIELESTPTIVAAIESQPEIVFEPTERTASVEPAASLVPIETAGRRRPESSSAAAHGRPALGDEHAPKVGEVRYFNGRPIRAVRTMRMRVTAYSPDHRSCGIHADGITASGFSVDVNGGRLVAADRRLFPFGSLLSVPGYASGQVVPVLDRGGAIKGSRLDVLYPTHEVAREWGVQNIDVMVWEYADGKPIGYTRPRGR